MKFRYLPTSVNLTTRAWRALPRPTLPHTTVWSAYSRVLHRHQSYMTARRLDDSLERAHDALHEAYHRGDYD